MLVAAAAAAAAWQAPQQPAPIQSDSTVPTGLLARPCVRHCTIVSLAMGLEVPKAALLELLGTIPARGLQFRAGEYGFQEPTYVQQVADLVSELVPLDPSEYEGGWMQSPSLGGQWRLRYTSSSMFRRNQGLTGYASLLEDEGVETPELYMGIDDLRETILFEEPLDPESAAAVGRYVRCEAGEVPPAVNVDCTWAVGAGDSLKVTPKRVTVGSRSWDIIDRRDTDEVDFDREKAIRVLGACTPIFLDNTLFILRAQIESVFFIFERA